MNRKTIVIDRRKFLRHLSAVPPLAALVMLRGQGLAGLVFAQMTPGTPAPTPAITPAALDCIAAPSMTEGPYFVDELLQRTDLRLDPTNNAVKPGVPLQLKIHVYRVNGSTCAPLGNAQIDLWHCDATGLYSDESANGTQGQKFLRGYQLTDAQGVAAFTTIYPGWYRGRTIHIHVKVRTFSTDGTVSYAFNSQFFFDDKLTDQVIVQPPYNGRGQRDTTNATDMVFNNTDSGTIDPHDLGERMLLTLVADGSGGYTSDVYMGVDLSQPSAVSGNGGPGGFGPPPQGQPPQGTRPAPPTG